MADLVVIDGRGRHAEELVERLASRGVHLKALSSKADSLLSFAIDVSASAAVFDGFPSGTDLREINDSVGQRSTPRIVVIGPLEPRLDVLVALSSGVSGYVPAPGDPHVVADAIETILGEQLYLPPAVSEALVEQLQNGGPTVQRPDGQPVNLSRREWEILVLLRQSRTTAEIAERLVIARVTVRSHVLSLTRKLGLDDRAQLTTSSWLVREEAGVDGCVVGVKPTGVGADR